MHSDTAPIPGKALWAAGEGARPLLLRALLALWLHLDLYLLFSVIHVGPGGATSFYALVTQTAERPYVLRQLLPLLSRALAWAAPAPAPVIEALQRVPILARALASLDVDRIPSEAFWALLIMYLSLIGFLLSFRHLARGAGLAAPRVELASFVALLGLPLFYYCVYHYDLLTLFLFTLGMALLVQGNLSAYLVLFPFATLNKETSLFLAMIFALYYWGRLPLRRYGAILAVQAGFYLLVKGGLTLYFAHVPGSTVQYYLPVQLRFFFHPLILGLHLLAVLIGLAVAWGWRQHPPFLRAAVLIAFPLYALYLLFGVPAEIRVFLELYPVLVLLLTGGLRSDSHP